MTTNTRTTWLTLVLASLLLPLTGWAQDDDDKDNERIPELENEIEIGLIDVDEASYAYGKYTGLTDDDTELLFDFRFGTQSNWDDESPSYFSAQGWRMGLDSRRLLVEAGQFGKQDFSFHYREIPNNKVQDAMTPFLNPGTGNQPLPGGWMVEPGSSNTRGFLNLDSQLRDVTVGIERKRFDIGYDRRLGNKWTFSVDYRHETKEGERTLGAGLGSSGGNPRWSILLAPVDYTTDIAEVNFNYAGERFQFGTGFYTSWFSQDPRSLVWQSPYGKQSQWADGTGYPDGIGQMALEPDNEAWNFKLYGAFNLGARTRISANFSTGEMEQDEAFFPYTINPALASPIPLPRNSANAKMDTTFLNLRLTSQLTSRLNIAANITYDDRDNKTPRDIYVYIGGDSENQKDADEGRINLPYSYSNKSYDFTGTYRLGRGMRVKGGVEYDDFKRDWSESTTGDEFSFFAGITFGNWEMASLSFDYADRERDIDFYEGNRTLILSHVPGTIADDDFENAPLLRKYNQTDRDREEFKGRLDLFPGTLVNFGITAAWFQDEYDENFLGLTSAEITSWSFDAGFYPTDGVAITAYYTMDEYESEQYGRSWRGSQPSGALDPDNDWWVDIEDDVDTWNVAVTFDEIGEWFGLAENAMELGFDYTRSDVSSNYSAVERGGTPDPLPTLTSDFSSWTVFWSWNFNENHGIRFTWENADYSSDDFALDMVDPDTLANVLLTGESAANYDLNLLMLSYSYRY